MKRKFGIVFMILGALMLLGAGGLHLMNVEEGKRAQEAAERYLPGVIEVIDKNRTEYSVPVTTQPQMTYEPEEKPQETQQPIDPNYYSTEMTVEVIDGYGFVGYITFPSIGVQLPVMSETDDVRLKLSPCRFYGSTKTNDLVIGGHNYWQHFGQIPDFKNGTVVQLVDMDGKQWNYELVTMEVLDPNDAQELIKGEYPLTLFTCTYGGGSRVTLRFDLIEE